MFLVYMHMCNITCIISGNNINDILKQNGWRGLVGLTVMIFKQRQPSWIIRVPLDFDA